MRVGTEYAQGGRDSENLQELAGGIVGLTDGDLQEGRDHALLIGR